MLNLVKVFSKNDIELAWDTLDSEQLGFISPLALKSGLRQMKIFLSQEELDRLHLYLRGTDKEQQDAQQPFFNFYALYEKWHG